MVLKVEAAILTFALVPSSSLILTTLKFGSERFFVLLFA